MLLTTDTTGNKVLEKLYQPSDSYNFLKIRIYPRIFVYIFNLI